MDDLPFGGGNPTATTTAVGGDAEADLLGLNETFDLDDLKESAKAIPLKPGKVKRPKLTHDSFFQADNGFKKLVMDFPKIRFKGKGAEFEDLSMMMGHYAKWLRDVYPYDDNAEDLVWKARQVLENVEKDDDGHVSHPGQKLHLFRAEYKRDGGVGCQGAREAVREESRRILQKAAAHANAAKAAAALSDEARLRIEANKKKAMELKQKKEAAALAREAAELEEMEAAINGAPSQPSATARIAGGGARASAFDDEEDDPFGMGFGMDDDFIGGSSAKPTPAAAVATQAVTKNIRAANFDDEEDDPFGFGFGMDDDDFGRPNAPKPTPTVPATSSQSVASQPVASQPVSSQTSTDDEKKRRMEANRQKALELKQRKAAAAAEADAAAIAEMEAAISSTAPLASTVPPAASTAAPGKRAAMFDDEEEDPFGLGFDMDDGF